MRQAYETKRHSTDRAHGGFHGWDSPSSTINILIRTAVFEGSRSTCLQCFNVSVDGIGCLSAIGDTSVTGITIAITIPVIVFVNTSIVDATPFPEARLHTSL